MISVCANADPMIDARAVAAAVTAAQEQARLRTSKHRASRAYRHEMIEVLLRRVLPAAINRAREAGDSG